MKATTLVAFIISVAASASCYAHNELVGCGLFAVAALIYFVTLCDEIVKELFSP